MIRNHNILNELTELGSSLPGEDMEQVYAVPVGYFEDLIPQVLNRIKALQGTDATEELKHLSPLLHSLHKAQPYHVPSGYFEQLEATLPAIAKTSDDPAEELGAISPLLSGLQKEMPYKVPQDYFENISLEKPASGKLFTMAKRSLFKYAVAAMFIGVIGTTAFLLLNKSQSVDKFVAKVNKEIKKTSEKELTQFIQYTEASQDIVMNEPKQEVKELLKDVPATELQKFLDEIADPEIASENEFINGVSELE